MSAPLQIISLPLYYIYHLQEDTDFVLTSLQIQCVLTASLDSFLYSLLPVYNIVLDM